MYISSKGRYAVRVLIDLATNGNNFISLTEISKRQNISTKYLEKIINILLKNNFVVSLKGSNGGYKLKKQPNDYSIYEILKLTGDSPNLAPCQDPDKKCSFKKKCSSVGYWNTLQNIIIDNLKKITLKDIIDKTY